MACNIDHIIDAAGNPVIPVGIAAAAVAREVLALIGCDGGGDARIQGLDYFVEH
jgi:hypothetical protein